MVVVPLHQTAEYPAYLEVEGGPAGDSLILLGDFTVVWRGVTGRNGLSNLNLSGLLLLDLCTSHGLSIENICFGCSV